MTPEIISEIEPKGQKKQDIVIIYQSMPLKPCLVRVNYR